MGRSRPLGSREWSLVLPLLWGFACDPAEDTAAPTDAELFACASPPASGSVGETDGPFVDISLGAYAACGLDAEGNTTCWGCANDDQPKERFRVLDLEYYHACGITTDGEARCWSWGPYDFPAEAAVVPEGDWADVSVGFAHTCWLSAAGEITCVGDNSEGQCDVPDGGPWAQVSAGNEHTCAVDVNGCGTCWGNDIAGETQLPEDWEACSIAQIDAGGHRTCFRSTSGAGECRGGTMDDSDFPPWYATGVTRDVSAGANLSCAIADGQFTSCDGNFPFVCSTEELPPGTAVDSAIYAVCALLGNGETSCWGGGFPASGGGDPPCNRGKAAAVFGG